jgi:hypothetical protein
MARFEAIRAAKATNRAGRSATIVTRAAGAVANASPSARFSPPTRTRANGERNETMRVTWNLDVT